MSRLKPEEQCGPPPVLPTELEGTLRYCGDADPKLVKKDWKPRYCILRKGHLAIYDKPTKPEDPNRPFAEVLLKDCIIGQTTVKENCFAIQSAGNTALFQAKDADERRSWLDELKSCIVSDSTTPFVAPSVLSVSSRLTASTSESGQAAKLTDSSGQVTTSPVPKPELASSAGTPPGATNSVPTFAGWKGGVQVLPPIAARPNFLRNTSSSRGESSSGMQTPEGEKSRQQMSTGTMGSSPDIMAGSPAGPMLSAKLRAPSPKPTVPVTPTAIASTAPLTGSSSVGMLPSLRRSAGDAVRKSAAPDGSPVPLKSSNSSTVISDATGRSAASSFATPVVVPVDGATLLDALQQTAPSYQAAAQTLNELQQRIMALQADVLAGADVPFLNNVHGELTSAIAALEGPLRTLYLLLPMPVAKEEKPKSLTAELDADPEFKEMMERETPATRPRNVTLRPLHAMLNEFDISADEKEMTSPRRGSPRGESTTPRDSKKEAEQLIAEMMSSNLMPSSAKRPPLKPSPSSPAMMSATAKPVAKPVVTPLKPVARPLPVGKGTVPVTKPPVARPLVKDDLLDELEKEDLLTPQK